MSQVRAPQAAPEDLESSQASTTYVLIAAYALVLVQICIRAWMVLHSWYNDDDFTFISRVFNQGPTAHALLDGYSGHFMPGGFWTTWLLQRTWPFEFSAPAVVILLWQLVADLGVVSLLRQLFGVRPGIIPLLALYLFTSFTVPQALWWAIAINQLPYLAAMAWSISAFMRYLRNPSPRLILLSIGWLVVGMLFYEKAVLIPFVAAFILVAYFTSGTWSERLRVAWTRSWAMVVTTLVAIAAYTAAYLTLARTFGAGQTVSDALAPTLENLALRGWMVGIFGGPLRWVNAPGTPLSFSNPSTLVILIAGLALALLVREISRSRVHGLRGLLLPLLFVLIDGLLLTGGRAALAGPIFGLDYRYLGEMSLVTAVGLGSATLPIPGATVQVTRRQRSRLLDSRRAIAGVTSVCSILGLVSSLQYATNWHSRQAGARYMQNLLSDISAKSATDPLIDQPLPGFVMWPLTFPANITSRVLRPAPKGLHFATSATDRLLIPDAVGHLRQVEIPPERRAVPPPTVACPYRAGHGMTQVPLDGPVAVGGFWVRMGYVATDDSTVQVSAGGRTYTTSVSRGLHNLYFQAGSQPFSSIEVGRLVGAHLCTSDVAVGRPVAGPAADAAPPAGAG